MVIVEVATNKGDFLFDKTNELLDYSKTFKNAQRAIERNSLKVFCITNVYCLTLLQNK